MKRCFVPVFLAVCAMAVAETPSWNPAEAARDAERDIHDNKIQFYWHGSIASFAPGVPIEIAKKYPHGDAGNGCAINDKDFFDRQGEYARRYNVRMYEYVRTKEH